MNLQSLNDLSTELSRLAFESEGEITAEMEAFTERLEMKVDAYGYLIKDIPHRVEALQESVRELQAVIKRYKAMEAGLKYKLESSMRTLGQTKLAGDRYEFKYVGCQKSLDIVDASAVPAQFLLPPEPNNMAIKAALSNGVDVPGARLAGGTYLKCSAVSKQ